RAATARSTWAIWPSRTPDRSCCAASTSGWWRDTEKGKREKYKGQSTEEKVLFPLCFALFPLVDLHRRRHQPFHSPVSFGKCLVALAETDPQLCAAGAGRLVEAAPRHRRDADVLHQVPRELDVVVEPERADVGHDLVRAVRLVDDEVMPLENLEEHV